MHYTGYKSKKVDAAIEGHIRIIADAVKKGIGDDFVSLILVGGFGRGEGSVKILKDNVVPLNDYDLYVVTKNSVSDDRLAPTRL